MEQCETAGIDFDETHALVFAGQGWHLGVLGIVASRLVDRFCRPVFVLSDAHSADGSPTLTGSGRSIPGFHLLQALESMPELFTRFGGHRQAAGLTMAGAVLSDFRTRFAAFASRCLNSDDLRPRFQVDAEASFADLNDESVGAVLALGPFGCGNPAPIFMSGTAESAGPAKILQGGKHLSVALRQNGRTLMLKAWNFGDRLSLFEPGNKLDVLFQVEDDPYSRKRGYGSWCLSLKDVRLAGP